MNVGLFGLGEAGSLFAADLVARSVPVSAYDPAGVPTPDGVTRHAEPAGAVHDADLVLSLTGGQDAETAIRQAIDAIPATALYADLSSSAPATKRNLADAAREAGFEFADVALMSTVPGKGLFTPAMAAGVGARRYVDEMGSLGVTVAYVSDSAGDAATRKLLRSIVVKGLAGLIVEALRAAEAAGCKQWVWENIVQQVGDADEAFVRRIVDGTAKHATRRVHEMEASRDLIEELGIDAIMTAATVANLRDVERRGIPGVPE